jgi:hypothetical protein
VGQVGFSLGEDEVGLSDQLLQRIPGGGEELSVCILEATAQLRGQELRLPWGTVLLPYFPSVWPWAWHIVGIQ